MKGDAMAALDRLAAVWHPNGRDRPATIADVDAELETIRRALTQEAAPVVPDLRGALGAVTRMVEARGEECICMDLAQDGRRCEFHTAQRIVTGYLLDSLPKANRVPDGERERLARKADYQAVCCDNQGVSKEAESWRTIARLLRANPAPVVGGLEAPEDAELDDPVIVAMCELRDASWRYGMAYKEGGAKAELASRAKTEAEERFLAAFRLTPRAAPVVDQRAPEQQPVAWIVEELLDERCWMRLGDPRMTKPVIPDSGNFRVRPLVYADQPQGGTR